MLATNSQVQETALHDSTASPSATSTNPPTRKGTATAQSVDTRASYFLKYTVPSAHESAELAPKSTPSVDISFAAPEMLPALTATIPENPSRRPATFAMESSSPRISHARSPTSMGCRYTRTAAEPEGRCMMA